MSHVEYRPVVGWERYLVGSDGSVIGPSGRKLSPGLDTYGYPQVLLYGPGGRATRKMRKVHHLVLEAFVGARPTTEHQGAHWDGNPQNNSAENLRWATAKENIADKIRHGRVSRTVGEIDGMSKLTSDQVREIRRRAGSGERQASIASDYGVSRVAISNIMTRKTWGHLV